VAELLGLAVWILGYWLLAGLAINLAYHRTLTHRSVRLWRPLERLLVTVGLPAGTPIQWVGNHRRHHARADVEGDPHSPLRDGFWYAHVGWYLGTKRVVPCALYALAGPLRVLFDGVWRPRTGLEHCHLAPDVAADPWYRFVSRPGPYLAFALLHLALTLGGAWALFGWAGFAAQWAAMVLVFNLGDAIDSLTHATSAGEGGQVEGPHGLARDGLVLGLLTLGEGWHRGHHEAPWSARHGLRPGQPDGIHAIIRALELVGLASEVRVASAPEPERITA
jgi:fatty-acid desaturase